MLVTRRAALAAVVVPLLAGLPGPALAGPVVLGTTQSGQSAETSLPAGWKFVYFGYTHCPDVCPLGLQTMAQVLDGLGPIADRLTPVFVTVDPERDTPQVMAHYVDFFHPRLIGVTPSPEQLQSMAAAWRIKFAKVDMGPGRDYLMDHTATIFLIDPDGVVAGRFSHNMAAAQMATKIRGVLESRP